MEWLGHTFWLVGCFGFNGPLRQYFSLYRAVSQREGERGERIDESKNVQTTPTRTYCKRNRLLPYCNPNCRTPRHWKFTQHHRTTRPPTLVIQESKEEITKLSLFVNMATKYGGVLIHVLNMCFCLDFEHRVISFLAKVYAQSTG